MEYPFFPVVPPYLEERIQPLKTKVVPDLYEAAHSKTDTALLEAIDDDIYLAFRAHYRFKAMLTFTEMCLPSWEGKSNVALRQFYSHRAAAVYAYICELKFGSYGALEAHMEDHKRYASSYMFGDPR